MVSSPSEGHSREMFRGATHSRPLIKVQSRRDSYIHTVSSSLQPSIPKPIPVATEAASVPSEQNAPIRWLAMMLFSRAALFQTFMDAIGLPNSLDSAIN
jgi:hypothetical protein